MLFLVNSLAFGPLYVGSSVTSITATSQEHAVNSNDTLHKVHLMLHNLI